MHALDTPPLSDDEAVEAAKKSGVTVEHVKQTILDRLVYERPMGDSEQSYFLPSRADGVNDMCVIVFLYHSVCLTFPLS